jgi:hypothetical protein
MREEDEAVREVIYTCDACARTKIRVPQPFRGMPKEWSYVDVAVEIGGTQTTIDLHLDVCPKCIRDSRRVGVIAKIVREQIAAMLKG